MSQHTEVSFPPEQTQTFHTDQENKKNPKSFREECFPPAAQLPHQKFAFTSREYSKLEREKKKLHTKIFIRIIYNQKIINFTHMHCVDCISSAHSPLLKNRQPLRANGLSALCQYPRQSWWPGLETETSPATQALQAVFTEKL